MKWIDGRSSDPFWQAYRTQRKNAKKRGIGFQITFGDWKNIWVSSGNWEQRGRCKGQYVMCRIGDKGDYVVGNVFIATNAENTRQAAGSRIYTDELRAKLSEIQRGRPHYAARGVKRGPMSDETKKKLSMANTGSKNPNGNRSRWSPMKTPLGILANGAEAARAFGITTRAAHLRCNSTTSKFQDWSYV